MPALTDSSMAAVSVEDAGVGSAVNDVSRELGSALGIAILGTVINGLYRDNVEDRLAGTVPTEVVEAAGEGIGVAAATAADLPDDLAAKVMTGASDGLVAAMNTGFWASVAITVASIVVAMAMLTDRSRSTQVEREVAGDPSAPTLSDSGAPRSS